MAKKKRRRKKDNTVEETYIVQTRQYQMGSWTQWRDEVGVDNTGMRLGYLNVARSLFHHMYALGRMARTYSPLSGDKDIPASGYQIRLVRKITTIDKVWDGMEIDAKVSGSIPPAKLSDARIRHHVYTER